MNLAHLKYAVEIADTGSMTKAAEKLYTSQPNLSRAMRELESALGITVFKRTSKGILPTPDGEQFLIYARKILSQVDEMESMYKDGDKPSERFSISVPRASYIACAFTEFVKNNSPASGSEFFYKETNALRAINNILDSDYDLGILRYQSVYDEDFKSMLEGKELRAELICEFNHVLLMSRAHPLASLPEIRLKDLKPFTEIAHADPFVPSMPLSAAIKSESIDDVDKHIFVFERGSQMDILENSPDTFMWVSPVPDRLLCRHSLTQRICAENNRKYRDVLIYKKSHALTTLDKAFIDELIKIKRELAKIPGGMY